MAAAEGRFAGALNGAMAATTRALYQQIDQAHTNLDNFRLTAVSHTHSLSVSEDATNRAVVTAIASYEYT